MMEATVHMAAPAPQERRRRRPRWRKWVFLGFALLLLLGFALPRAVAPLVAARLARALGTRVEIGALTFQPIDAVVTLHDVVVHAPGSAPADHTPPIVAERVRADLQWLPLLHRTLQVRELEFESARVDLDRFPDGHFGLANLERANPTSELPPNWSFALDRITLRNSQLRVHDLGAADATLLEATLREATVSAMPRRASAFGKATNLRVDAVIGRGGLGVRGHYELRDDGLVLDAQVRVKDVPLDHLKSYVADLGWTDLSGLISGQLRWQREPRRRDLLRGRVILRRGSVRVARLAEPALSVRRAIADVAAVDLLKRRITVRSVTLRGALLALRPDTAVPIPLLATALSGPPPRVGRRDNGPRYPARASTPQWSWLIERVDTTDSGVRLLAPAGRFDLRAQAAAENLGAGAYWSPLRVAVAGEEAAAAFDGTVRLTHGLTIEGRLTADRVDFVDAARATGLPWADLVQAGHATADLNVGFDPTIEKAPPLYARGAIGLTDVWIAGPDPSAFAFWAGGVDLTLGGFSLREPAAQGDRGAHPARITFSAATVDAPFLLLTRSIDGWILPPFAPAIDAAPEAVAAPEPPASDTPQIILGDVHCGGGNVMVVDLVPTPAVTWDVARVSGSAHAVSLPGLTFDGLQLRGFDPRFGELGLAGNRRGATTNFEASGLGVPLAATTPYLRLAGLPYSFASGKGAFSAHGSIAAARWSADAVLTLRDPTLTGSETALQDAIGMAVPSALALLRDQDGDVTVQLALASARADSRDTYAESVAAGVREAMRRADEAARTAAAARLPPLHLRFRPGQVELNTPAMEELARVAELLGEHPDLLVELAAETSYEDRRWLAEQALQGELQASGGFMNVLRALGMRDARDRIRSALAARAHGAPGPLDRDDEALLARLVAEAPPIDDAQLVALGDTRLTRVTNHLADRYGIGGERVVVHGGAAASLASSAAVRVQVSIGSDPTADPHASPSSRAADFIGPPLPPRPRQ